MQVMFPFQLMARDAKLWLTGQSQDVQQGLAGADTVVASFKGRWRADISYVIKGREAGLAMQAFLASMEGRLGTTLVPFRARWRPYDRDGKGVTQCLTAAMPFAQHFGLVAAPSVTGTVLVAAALRATRLSYVNGDTTGLQPGQVFSIGERAYRVQLLWRDDLDRTVVQFQPPLREAVGVGAVMVLDATQCRMRLLEEFEGDFSDLGMSMQSVTLSFVEAI